MKGCVYRARILKIDGEKGGTGGYFSGNNNLSRGRGRSIVVKHVVLKNKPDISGTGISMAVLQSIRSAVKIKVEGNERSSTNTRSREASRALNRTRK